MQKMLDQSITTKYPIYIPSHGRADSMLLPPLLKKYKVPFTLVVDESQWELYKDKGFEPEMLKLPFLNNGTSFPPRTFITQHSRELGHKRHWQIDDNIRSFKYFDGQDRIKIHPGTALRLIENFCDRWKNVAIYGPNYSSFTIPRMANKPYRKNTHIYSCMCVLNSIPFEWRGPWNEDVDLCLQALAHKYCTIATNFICSEKMATMKTKGGNTTAYQNLDVRAYGARTLVQRWPGVVELANRYGRPHFKVVKNWQMFKDIPLLLDPDYIAETIKIKAKVVES
jgi:hypothetical protein